MLFHRHNNSPIDFDLLDLEDSDYSTYSKIIVRNGGRVLRDDKMPIKFTKPNKYVNKVYPQFNLYDVAFIADCAERFTIVDPAPYKLSKSYFWDSCVMAHFLYGAHDCCEEQLRTKRKIARLSNSDMKRARTRDGSISDSSFTNVRNGKDRNSKTHVGTKRNVDRRSANVDIKRERSRDGSISDSSFTRLRNGKVENSKTHAGTKRKGDRLSANLDSKGECSREDSISDSSCARVRDSKRDIGERSRDGSISNSSFTRVRNGKVENSKTHAGTKRKDDCLSANSDTKGECLRDDSISDSSFTRVRDSKRLIGNQLQVARVSINSIDPYVPLVPLAGIKRQRSSDGSSSDSGFTKATKAKVENNKKRPGRRAAYSKKEAMEIVKYVIEHDKIDAGAFTVASWNDLVKSGKVNRSATSLYQHYRIRILPKIEQFNLSDFLLEKFIKTRSELATLTFLKNHNVK